MKSSMILLVTLLIILSMTSIVLANLDSIKINSAGADKIVIKTPENNIYSLNKPDKITNFIPKIPGKYKITIFYPDKEKTYYVKTEEIPVITTNKENYYSNEEVIINIKQDFNNTKRILEIINKDNGELFKKNNPETEEYFKTITKGYYDIILIENNKQIGNKTIKIIPYEIDNQNNKSEEKKIQKEKKINDKSEKKRKEFVIEGIIPKKIIFKKENKNYTHKTAIPGIYDIGIYTGLKDFSPLELINVTYNVSMKLKFEEVPDVFNRIEKKGVEYFAIDPTEIQFDYGIVSKKAKGTELWKCSGWNFNKRICNSGWEKIQDITPGKYYSIKITSKDPAFVETDESQFIQGTYNNTYYNTSTQAITLNNSYTEGNFTSRIIDSEALVNWTNISWIPAVPYKIPLPNNGNTEKVIGGANMSNNVLLMHFNELSGTLNDDGPNNYGTSITGSITYSEKGIYDRSTDFGGSGDATISSFNDLNGANKFTVEMWIKQNTNTQNQYTLWRNGNILIQYGDSFNIPGSTNLRLRMNLDGAWRTSYTATSVLDINTWHHWTFTWDGTNTIIYKDAKVVLNSTADSSYSAISTSTDNLQIGARSTYRLDGNMDELAIYTKALTAKEVEEHYTRGRNNITIKVRSCTQKDCSDSNFSSSLTNNSLEKINVNNNRYFQFKALMTGIDSNFSPELFNVTIGYTIIDDGVPSVTSINPASGTIITNTKIPDFNFTVTENYASNLNCSLRMSNDSVWWNRDYSHRKSLTITGSDENFTKTISANITGINVNDCTELRVIKTIGTNNQIFPYEIIGGDNSTYCNIKFNANITKNPDNTFFVYYGNSNNIPGNSSIEDIIPVIQRGSITSTGTTITDSINEVNINESFILMTASADSNAPDRALGRASFSGNKTVQFDYYDGTSTKYIEYQIISVKGNKVQRGTQVLTSSDLTADINLTDNVNLNNSFIIIYGTTNSGVNGNTNAGFVTGVFLNESRIHLERLNSGSETTVSWQVVEWPGTYIQRGNKSTTGTTMVTSINQINLSKSFIIMNKATGGDSGLDANHLRARFTSNSEVTIERNVNQGTMQASWFAIELPGSVVQSGTEILTSDLNKKINSTKTNNTLIIGTNQNTGGGTTYQNAQFTINLTNSTNIFFDKKTASQTTTIDWFNVEAGIDSAIVGSQETENSIIYSNNNNVLNNTLTSINPDYALGDGTYYWFIECSDGALFGYSEYRKIIMNVNDSNPPIIILNYPFEGSTIKDFSNVTFNFTATDNIASLMSCNLQINSSETKITDFFGINKNTINNTLTSIQINHTPENGLNKWWINCSDGDNNAISEKRNVTFSSDTQSPKVSLKIPTNNYANVDFSNLYFKCNVSDDLLLKNTTLYTNFEKIWSNDETTIVTGKQANATFTPSLLPSNKFISNTYEWNCLVYDNTSKYSWATSNFSFSNFDRGSYSNTYYNSTNKKVEIINSSKTGKYTSEIFDAEILTSWDNVEWESTGKGIPNNAVLYFKLNNDSSKEESNSLIYDYSGNNNNGTPEGNAQPTISGKYDGGYLFDGTNDQIRVTDSSNLEGMTELTLEAWIYPTTLDSPDGIISKRTSSSSNQQYSLFVYNGGSGSYTIYFDLPDGSSRLGGNTTITTNNWYHVVAVFNGSASPSTQEIFLNGKSIGFTTTSTNSIPAGPEDLMIGILNNGYGSGFDGIIDEVVVYNKSLSQQKINERYQSTSGKLNLYARSCYENLCRDAEWKGPYTEGINNIVVDDNKYFQYKTEFEAINNQELNSIKINYSSSSLDTNWLNHNWLYRKPITITETSGNNLNNFQEEIILDTKTLISEGKMNSDCSDLRTTDANSSFINYWIEGGCNTLTTSVWIKINISASASDTYYIYYGNPAATVSIEDIDKVMGFIEFGSLTTNNEEKTTINLTKSHEKIVVTASPQYTSGDPTAPIIENTTKQDFVIWMDEQVDGTNFSGGNRVINYLVTENGSWYFLNDKLIQAEELNTIKYGYAGANWDDFETINFGLTFTNAPAVFHTRSSYNTKIPYNTFSRGISSRTVSPGTTTMGVAFDRGLQGSATDSVSDNLSWIAVEEGTGDFNGTFYDFLISSDSIQGYSNSPPYNTNYIQNFTSAPSVALSSMQRVDGTDGGWGVTYGSATSTTHPAMIDEATSGNRAHTNEEISIAAFSNNGSIPIHKAISSPPTSSEGSEETNIEPLILNVSTDRSYYDIGTIANITNNVTINNSSISANTTTDIIFGNTTYLWGNLTFGYRKEYIITENSGSTLRSYQVAFTIDTQTLISEGKMNSDCSDIRVIDESENYYDYYVSENPFEDCNSTSTKVWTKITSLSASSNKTAFIYYGNNSISSKSNISAVFGYDSPTTVGYVVSDNLAGSTLDLISLEDGNTVEVGSSQTSLNDQEITSYSSLSQSSAIKATKLIHGDSITDGTDAYSPISWANTFFTYDSVRGTQEFSMLSPWGTANVVIRDGSSTIWSGTVDSTGTSVTQDVADGNAMSVTSDIPILVQHVAGTTDSMLFCPATSNYLYGVPSGGSGVNSFSVSAGSSGASVSWVLSDGTSASTSLSAYDSYGQTTTGSQGTEEAWRVKGNEVIGVRQTADSDGSEATTFLPSNELGKVFGGPQVMQYIAIAAPKPNTNCTLYDNLGVVDSSIVGGSRTDVNKIYFGSSSTSAHNYLAGGWKLICDKPVFAYYERDTGSSSGITDETNLLSYLQMRQYTYPEPTITAKNNQKIIKRFINNTNSSGLNTLNFNTSNQAEGNYSAVTLAEKTGYVDAKDYAYFRLRINVGPSITMINPVEINETLSFSGIGNPSNSHIAWDGYSTSQPTTTAPIGGNEATDSEYLNLVASDNVRFTTTLSSNTGEHVYQSFKFKTQKNPADMLDITFTYEGYATRQTFQYADNYSIYIYNYTSDNYDLLKAIIGSTSDVLTSIKINNTKNYFIAGSIYFLVEGNHISGSGADSRADLYTDKISLNILSRGLLSRKENITLTAVDEDGINYCNYNINNETYTGSTYLMSYISGDKYQHESNTTDYNDSNYNLSAYCEDDTGMSTSLNTRIRIDNTAPYINLLIPVNHQNFTNTNNINLTWNVTDNAKGVMSCNLILNKVINETSIFVNDGLAKTINFTNMSDGYYNWSVNCTDIAGNNNISTTKFFTVDNNPPNVTLSFPSNSTSINYSNITFTFLPSDGTGINNCSLYVDDILTKNSSNINNSENNSFLQNVNNEGSHNWTVKCTDIFGSEGTSKTFNFLIDKSPPVISLLTPDGVSFLGTAILNYSVVDNYDNNLTCNVTINGVVWDANISSVNNTNISRDISLPDGEKTWNVTCWDNAMNINVSESRSFTITGGPFIQINSPENQSQVKGSFVEFNYTTQDIDGVNNCSLHFDNNLNQTNTVINDSGGNNYFNLTNVTEGNHKWQITCFDNTGLEGITKNFTLYVDNTPPSITLFKPNGETYNKSLTDFNFTAKDNYASQMTCNLTVDGTVHPDNENFVMDNNTVSERSQTLSNGNHVWSISCVDIAGNLNTSVDYSFVTQNSVPANVTLTSDKSKYVANQIAQFTTTVLDSTSNGLESNISIIVVNTSNEDIWSYAGLPYRTRINLSNQIATNLTDFATKIIIDTTSIVNDELMQPDCSDIRFADNEGTPVNFYLESGCGTSNMILWLKINLGPLETKSFYYYYGNTSYNSVSNSTATFANIEVGKINVSDESYSIVNIKGSFSDPIIIANPEYTEGPNAPPYPSGIIIKNVNSDFFQIKADRPEGILSNNVTINYMIVDRGNWVLFDTNSRLLADSVNTTNDGYSSGNFGSPSYAEEVTFDQSFDNDPLVFATRNTENNNLWGLAYVMKPGDLSSYPNSTSADIGLTSVQLGNQNFVNDEVIGWIGVETGLTGNVSSTLYSTDRSSSNNVAGWINSPYAHPNSYGQTYSSTPKVIIVMMETIIGANGGWAGLAKNKSDNTTWYSFIDESSESDRSHTNEYVASFSFEKLGVHGMLFDNSTTRPTYQELEKEKIIAKKSGFVNNGILNFNWNTTGVSTGTYGVSTRAVPNSTFDLPNYDSLIVEIINDIFGPNITLISPVDLNTSSPGSINFIYNVTDDNTISNCSIYVNEVLNQTDNSSIGNFFDGNFTISFAEGAYNWSVKCYDYLGNLGNSENRTLYVDGTGPDITLNYPMNEVVLNENVTMNYTVNDNYANNLSCELTVDGFSKDTSTINNSANALINVTGLSDGDHSWDVTCYDIVNNQGSNSSGNFTVDTEPVVALDSPADLYGQESENISLGYTVTDISLNNCSLILNDNINMTHNSSEILYQSSDGTNYFNLTDLNEGIYNWGVECYDAHGLHTNTSLRNFHIDNDYPVIELLNPANQSSVYSGSVTFSWNATDLVDPVLTCSLIINDSVNQSGISSVNGNITNQTVNGFTAGSYNWKVSCEDQSSHSNFSIKQYFTIESTPLVTLVNPAENKSYNSGSNLELTYLPTGVEGFTLGFCDLYIDEKYNQTDATITEGSNNNFTVTNVAEGNHTWLVNCTDSAGGITFDGPRKFYVDLTNPVVSLHSPDGDLLNSSSVLFNWTATDNIDTELSCNIYVNNSLQLPSGIASINNTPTTYQYSGFTDGSFFWNVTCFDDSGRNSTSSKFSFTVQEAPTITLGNPPDNNRTTNTNNEFFYTPEDNSNNLSSCELIFDGVVNQTDSTITEGSENSMTVNNMGAGSYSWSINCTDPSGNEGHSSNKIFMIDLNGPTVDLISPSEEEFLNDNDISFSWNATDDFGTDISCDLYYDSSLNKSGIVGTSASIMTYQLTNQTDGPHNWSVSCSDDLGNAGSSVTGNFTINSPDFILNNGNVSFNNSNPDLNENITIQAVVHNIGGIGKNAYLEVWDGIKGSGIMIGNQTNFVELNSSVQFNISWIINSGYHNLHLYVDPDNTVYELNETNNNATINISVLSIAINSPSDSSLFNSSPQDVKFTMQDYTGGSINYSIYINSALQTVGQNTDNNLVTESFTMNEGTNTLYIITTDSLGRTKTSQIYTYYLDTTPPVLIWNTQNSTWFNNNLFNISFNISDNLDSNIFYDLYLDSVFNRTNNASSGSVVYEGFTLVDGKYNITSEPIDNANNTKNYSIIVFVDTTSPAVSLIAPANGNSLFTTSTSLNYTVSDNLDSILSCDLYMDNSLQDSSSVNNNSNNSVAVSGISEGTHWWNATCTDEAGNTGYSQNWNFSMFIAPVINLTYPANNYLSNNQTINFTFNVSDDTGIENCSLLIDEVVNSTKTGSQITNGGENNFLINNLQGKHNWAVECYDNTSQKVRTESSSRNFTVDINPPEPYINTANRTWFNSSPSIDFNISDDFSATINYQFYVDGVANVNGQVSNNTASNDTLSGLTNGTYAVLLEGTDLANNSKNSSSIKIYVDTVSPEVTLYNPSENQNLTSNSVKFNFTLSDNMAQNMSYYFYIDGGLIDSSVANNNSLINYTETLNAGSHTWHVVVTDLAGNSYTSETINFSIVPPDLTINAGNITFNTSTAIENDNITVFANVWNIGNTQAGSFNVQIYYGNPDDGGIQLGNNYTITSLSANSNITINATYLVPIGNNDFYVLIDTPLSTNGSVMEDNESNNEAYNTMTVGLWNFISGNSSGKLVVDDLTNISVYEWLVSNITGSNLMVADIEAKISFNNLTALSRDITGTYHVNDFNELDKVMGSENFSDSVNFTYTKNNNPLKVNDYTVFSKTINNVPVVNSTNNSNFQTGILWDAEDGGIEYNGTQDIIFISEIKKQQQGKNNLVDYEIRVPALLRRLNILELTKVYIYTEIK